jgi:hypothetical protein
MGHPSGSYWGPGDLPGNQHPPKINFLFVCPFCRAKALSPVKAVNSRYRKGGIAMKSIVRNFALSAAAAVSTANQRTFRFKKGHLLLALGLMAPLQSFAASEAPYCIAVNGGFGNGGTTFVARNFTLPAGKQVLTVDGLHQDRFHRRRNHRRDRLPVQR